MLGGLGGRAQAFVDNEVRNADLVHRDVTVFGIQV
jgi:hypothetical protein